MCCTHAAPRTFSPMDAYPPHSASFRLIPPHSIPSRLRSQDTSACDEPASPHVLIDVLISLMGILRGQQKARQVEDKPAGAMYGICVCVRTYRETVPDGSLPADCSPRAWCKCYWCASARCAGTP